MTKSKKSGEEKQARKRQVVGETAETITSEEALDFIRRLQEEFPKTPRTEEEKERLQEYLAQFTDGLLKSVGRRVQSDLMLRPPRTIPLENPRKPPPHGHDSAGSYGDDDDGSR